MTEGIKANRASKTTHPFGSKSGSATGDHNDDMN